MEYVAIDLGRPNSVMSEYGLDGRKVRRSFALNRSGLDRWFKGRRRSRVLIESSTEAEWVATHLEALDHEVVVADPNYAAMYGERNRRVKTDGRDADALLEANRLGVYRRAHRRSTEQRNIIGLLGTRDSLIRSRTRLINVIRALMRREGYRVRSGSVTSFRLRVAELDPPDQLQNLIHPLLEVMEPLNDQLKELDRKILDLGNQDSRVRLLQTTPMIGPVTAAAFVALIDDVKRFPRAHRLECYLGVVPSEWSSSERRLKLGITKRGDSRMRWLLVEASWSILRSRRLDCRELRRWAEGIAARRGRKIAVVALARRLSGILYAMLRDNKPYDATRIGEHPRRKVA